MPPDHSVAVSPAAVVTVSCTVAGGRGAVTDAFASSSRSMVSICALIDSTRSRCPWIVSSSSAEISRSAVSAFVWIACAASSSADIFCRNSVNIFFAPVIIEAQKKPACDTLCASCRLTSSRVVLLRGLVNSAPCHISYATSRKNCLQIFAM